MGDDRYVLRFPLDDPGRRARWEAAAAREGRDLAAFIRWAVDEYVRKKSAKHPTKRT